MELLETFITNTAAFIVTIGILVTVHEYGHFWVARRCGVKVLRFSIGFGKPLWSWYDRSGTEFVIAAIPLGGYVKMLDEKEGKVADHELHLAFNRMSPWRRIAIVAAGPVTNFLLAIVVFWAMFLNGATGIVPIIGEIRGGSPAAQHDDMSSGYEIVSVDGNKTATRQEVNYYLFNRLGESGYLTFGLSLPGSDTVKSIKLPIDRWMRGHEEPNPLHDLGITFSYPAVPPIVGEVVKGSPAALAGLKAADKLIKIDQTPIGDWRDWVAYVQARPGVVMDFLVLRNGQELNIWLTPASIRTADDKLIGHMGVKPQSVPWPDNMLRKTHYSFFGALMASVAKTWSMTSMNLTALKKLVTGQLSLKNLSGPVGIATVAGSAVKTGLESFLFLLALISISLGILNLLPIPVLDGGHLLYYTAELLMGKPIPERIQMMGLQLGIFVLVTVMLLAFYYDLNRLL